jgi:hypothetical protein
MKSNCLVAALNAARQSGELAQALVLVVVDCRILS